MNKLDVLIECLPNGSRYKAEMTAEIARLRKDLEWERNKNNIDAKRLRKLAMLLGLSIPESDETLLCCAGKVLAMAARAIESIFNKPEKP